MPIAPFSIVQYSYNPSFYQIGQTVSILPVPGFSAVSYTITEGTLPAGLSLNATTGAITGTPTGPLEASTVTIQAVQANSNVTACNVIINIVDTPSTAPDANEISADDLTALRQTAETRFIEEVTAMIANNQKLGRFELTATIPLYASMKNLRQYFENLGYGFWLINWRNAYQYQTVVSFGDFSANFWPYTSDYPYGDFYFSARAGYPVASENLPRVRITWKQTQFCPIPF